MPVRVVPTSLRCPWPARRSRHHEPAKHFDMVHQVNNMQIKVLIALRKRTSVALTRETVLTQIWHNEQVCQELDCSHR